MARENPHRHPAFHFLRYLYLTGDASPSDESAVWRARMDRLGMAAPGEVELREAQRVLSDFPYDLRPADWAGPLGEETQAALRGLELYDIARPDVYTARALRLVRDGGPLRMQVERLLACGMRPSEAAFNLRDADPTLTVQVLTTFQHYWWNHARMDPTSWIVYVQHCPRWRIDGQGLLKEIAVGRPAALYRVGKSGDRANTLAALGEMFDATTHAFRQLSRRPPTGKSVAGMRALATTALRLHEALSEDQNAAEKVMQRFSAFSENKDESETPALATVVTEGGSVSDGAKGSLARQRFEEEEAARAKAPSAPTTPPPPPRTAGGSRKPTPPTSKK